MGKDDIEIVNLETQEATRLRKKWVAPSVREHGNLSELIRGFSGPDCDSGGLSACSIDSGDPCSGSSGQCL